MRIAGWIVALGLSVFSLTAAAEPLDCAPPAQTPLCAALNPTDAHASNLHGVVVARRGVVIAERYLTGSDKTVGELFGKTVPFNATTLHDVRSISKSVVSLLIGIAIGEGKIASLDTPIADLLGRDVAADKRAITVRHLLTMSAGLTWSEGAAVSLLSDETRMEFSNDMVGYVLGRPVAAKPGATYLYCSGATILLGAILERATGMSVPDYAKAKLFEPLGISQFAWARGQRDQVMAHSGLRLTPRDLSKIGQLMLYGGHWQGRQIVPSAYVAASQVGVLAAEQDWRYGLQWRTGAIGGRAWTGGFGNGGQRLYIVPALDLVVVVTAGRYNKPYPENGRASDQLFGAIVAALDAQQP
jgi:CubicO group peptidase (beta-lactamase class C family)